ncbi:lactosylceramide 4-alpha-galactosyltransferase-like [Drosophila guanche]|uniref:Blast:Lactosylceramide 4-alpha-galactosyltransferase n=1 Tax=Drosophila guanche TaxID=7266 RepID=A0A3B0J344_DROGU|nr:lactosylceramide 4-alpha-galactosyltransferase-like [Drosophila guanche]SPP73623.1 blast:Lactosylceramide 4-alpha-galactosyltransferase [Drosophila guanche]
MLLRRILLLFVALITIGFLIGSLALACSYLWKNSYQEEESIRIDDVLLAEPKPTPGRGIFFHETSSFDDENKEDNVLKLNARQACAVESAALHNPNFQVFLLFAVRKDVGLDDDNNGRKTGIKQPLVDALLSYNNVHLRRLHVWRYAAGTPSEEWLNTGYLFCSRYIVVQMSDFLRFLTLFRYGGLYLDLDVVVLQNMEDMPANYAGVESDLFVANGVMRFSHNGTGHDIARRCLRDFQLNFNGYEWGYNGPWVITRVVKEICGTDKIPKMLHNTNRCKGFKVYDQGAFFAVPGVHWRDFLEPDKLEQTMALTKSSYLVHVWNRNSKNATIKVATPCAYLKMAEQNCPRVFHAAGEYF